LEVLNVRKNKRVIFARVDEDAHRALKAAAAIRGMSLNVLVEKTIADVFVKEIAQAQQQLAEEKH
jgi:predicted HicB family RNase H-like nuclease